MHRLCYWLASAGLERMFRQRFGEWRALERRRPEACQDELHDGIAKPDGALEPWARMATVSFHGTMLLLVAGLALVSVLASALRAQNRRIMLGCWASSCTSVTSATRRVASFTERGASSRMSLALVRIPSHVISSSSGHPAT